MTNSLKRLSYSLSSPDAAAIFAKLRGKRQPLENKAPGRVLHGRVQSGRM